MFPLLAITFFLASMPIPGVLHASDPTTAADAVGPPPAAARWLGRVNAGEPGAFPTQPPFAASYRVSWGGLEAARVESRCTAPEGGSQIQLAVKASTTGLARTLYPLDATHVSVVDRRTLHPVRLDQSETGSGKREAAHVDFTPEEAVRTNPGAGGKAKSKFPGAVNPAKLRPRHYRYPNLYDITSAFLYLRSLPMNTGDEKTLVLMTASTPYLTTIKVLGRSRVRVDAGEFPAVECSLALEKINKQGEVEPRKGFKSARAWVSDDANRMLIKAEADIFIGAVTLELEKVNYTGGATE